MASDTESRKLNDLRVVDLRSELEKRDLDKNGIKAVLIERLQKALTDEGHDPDTYVFELSDVKKTPVRGKKSDNEEASEDDKGEDDDESSTKPKDNDESLTEDIKPLKNDESDSVVKPTDAEVKTEVKEEPPKDKSKDTNSETSTETTKDDKSEEKSGEDTKVNAAVEAPKAKPVVVKDKPTSTTQPKEEKPVPEVNGVIDNEDSINLTIGEDEAKLLADEEESSQEKDGKDESHGRAGQKKTSEKTQDKSNQEKADGKSSTGDKAAKDDKNKKAGASSSRNLWVSGLATTTRATDLKQVFSKYGKVIGAKVVTNARTPGARCYGYVTMGNPDDASKAVQFLHHTELHGRLISVEKAKGDSTGPPKRSEPAKAEAAVKREPVRKPDPKKEENIVPPGTETDLKKEPAAPGTEEPTVKKESKEGGHRSREPVKSGEKLEKRPRSSTSHRSGHRGGSPVLTFEKIKEERDRQRLREKERILREEERRRETERLRQREIDRKQREEFEFLDREKRKLKMERERLLREKDELLKLKTERQRLERERQKLERERLEKEREELERLRRQTMKLEEEARRKRSLSASRDREYESRKKPATESRYVAQSSSSRYIESSRSSDYKKEPTVHKSSREVIAAPRRPGFESDSRRMVTSVSSSARDSWPPSKDRESGRYERTSVNSSNFREEPSRSKPTESRHVRERYADAPPPKSDRFERSEPWPVKSYSRDTWVGGSSSDRKPDHLAPEPWARTTSSTNRWPGNSNPLGISSRSGLQGSLSNQMFSTNNVQIPSMNMGLSSLTFSGGDRFDAYKQPYFKP